MAAEPEPAQQPEAAHEPEAVREPGDHYLVVGRVTRLGACRAGRPLLFYRGRYAATDPGQGPAEVVDTLLAWPRHADWM